MTASALFWDKIAQKYAKDPVPNEQIYQKKLSITQEYLGPHSQVLELACGTGTTALHHAAKAGHIRATDISENMLAIAREKQQAAGVSNVDFECVSLEHIDYQPGSYDMVMAHSILHLVDDREQALARIYDMLKPGGIFISSTACLGNGYSWLKLLVPLMKVIKKWPAVYFFKDKLLAQEIGKKGFEILQHWLPEKGPAVFIVAKKPQ
ncbi:Ubiquinone/menaquinone biosynthesis C-methylase UbiE [Alteromonadaceae bacterium Bs31]|nr:Ubiquinone/menaquinone biosynthesis C-methylase UbiE [Alteromonadaceae bacterium Bs31]